MACSSKSLHEMAAYKRIQWAWNTRGDILVICYMSVSFKPEKLQNHSSAGSILFLDSTSPVKKWNILLASLYSKPFISYKEIFNFHCAKKTSV